MLTLVDGRNPTDPEQVRPLQTLPVASIVRVAMTIQNPVRINGMAMAITQWARVLNGLTDWLLLLNWLSLSDHVLQQICRRKHIGNRIS